MKLTKLITVVLLVTAIAIASCKSKSAKDLIVNKWKVTNVSGTQLNDLTDSMKTVIYATATMEFTNDGKFISSGMGPTKGGTYSVSDDGKTLTTTDEGSTTPDMLDIAEISKDKMVVKDKKEDMQITFGVK